MSRHPSREPLVAESVGAYTFQPIGRLHSCFDTKFGTQICGHEVKWRRQADQMEVISITAVGCQPGRMARE